MTGPRGIKRSAASALVGMVAAASVRVAVSTAAILPNFSIMTRLPLFICLPTETSNEAPAGISRPLSRDISRYGKSEDRWATRKHFCIGSHPEELRLGISSPLHPQRWGNRPAQLVDS